MKSAFYDAKPSKFEAVGNGSYIYRWDIEEVKVESTEEQSDEVQYSCLEVVVWAPITSNKIMKEVMSAMYPNNREQKYINEYNSATLGVYSDDVAAEKIKAYKDFLVERDGLKSQVDSDCKELGIL